MPQVGTKNERDEKKSKNFSSGELHRSKSLPFLKTVKGSRIPIELIKSTDEQHRVIFECPEQIPGIGLGEPREVNFERTVVTSDFFGPGLPEGSILFQHSCWFYPVQTQVKAHLTLAKVAGYRNIVYGMPEKCHPVLFEHPDNPNILISTIQLSNFIEGRFAPKKDWQTVIGRLRSWLNNRNDVDAVDWQPSVSPSFGPEEELPGKIELIAFNRNVEWFNNNIFFEHVGRIGVFEGYMSAIAPNGRQSPRPKTRGDCSGEATMIPALDWVLNKNYPSRRMTSRIMDNLFNGPELADNDPISPTYGSLRFYEYVPTYYSEGRAPLACILASELTNNYNYAENIMRCLLSLLRTTNNQGFRMYCLTPKSFEGGKTWKYYQNMENIECRPHYLANVWAAFLQGYALTGYKDFLEKAKTAINIAMNIFPDFLWQNGINAEYARLLLPLSFLVELENIPEHRHWLREVTKKLLDNVVSCGAIQEKMGKQELGKYPAPISNEEYGAKEASLIQQNGDPVIDLVYTVNFAFIGLHEAFYATGEKFYKSAADKLAEFFCRVQVRSDEHKYLDGAWMHGFDYEQWDFFGNPSDHLWGPWCVESGWTNTWIAATLALRALKRPFLCCKNGHIYKKIMPGLLKEMSVVHDFNLEKRHTSLDSAPGND